MSEDAIEVAIYARLSSLSLTPAHPIAWPRVSFDPTADRYLEVTLFRVRPERLFLAGADPHRRQALLQVAVVHALSLGVGAPAATEIACDVRDHFPADLRLTASTGERVRVTEMPEIGSGFPDDAWWRVPVSIRFETYA